MCRLVKAINVLFSAANMSGAAREDTRGRRNKRRWRNGEERRWEETRMGGFLVGAEGRVSGLTGRHRLCQRFNEGARGSAHLVVGVRSKVASS